MKMPYLCCLDREIDEQQKKCENDCKKMIDEWGRKNWFSRIMCQDDVIINIQKRYSYFNVWMNAHIVKKSIQSKE